MEMIAHDPEAAKRAGVPQSVGEEFVKADQKAGKHFKGPTRAERAARRYGKTRKS